MTKETKEAQQTLALCKVCLRINDISSSHCIRCHHALGARNFNTIATSWALLLTAAILLIPANIYPISIITNQGQVTQETIFSGIISLIHSDMLPIAIIVFTASILVPWLKILGIAIFLIAIKFKLPLSKTNLMIGFKVIEWIGRWSMLDLFVISITTALINMGQLLDAKPAPAATAFALVILFTQLAAKVIDTRLLWDQMEVKHDAS